MKQVIYIIVACCLTFSCEEETSESLRPHSLSALIQLNSQLEMDNLIACAAGNNLGDFGTSDYPTAVFFYPEHGATDYQYYEAVELEDSLNFDAYFEKPLSRTPVFNGYLRKFELDNFSGERMGIVTYKTEGKLHISDPIRIKTNQKPTEVNSDLVTLTPSGTNPKFNWVDGLIDENVIYFQVISELDGTLISGTYTYERMFTFYELNNVVLNITDPDTTSSLTPNTEYKFTMMAVSEDNWVNLLIERQFKTTN